MTREPAIWFLAVRTETGTDVFTERLADGLSRHGIRVQVTWLPLRAEFAPWTVLVPKPPSWATVVHVNTWLHSRFLPKHLPIVATIHHSVHHPDFRVYKGAARATYHRHWIAPNERRVLHRARSVISVSHFVAETARRTLLDVPMQVIYNGVDTDIYRPSGRQKPSGRAFRLLYVGSWMTRKGVDLLAPIMCDLGGGFELHYTGGPKANKGRQAMPANMHDIRRLSGTDNIVAAMQDADALLFPSRSEGFGLVVAEAMVCGLPVIATRGSSLTEVVEDGITGMLCPQDDVAAFVEAAKTLAAESDRAVAMSRTARHLAEKRFSIGAMIDDYLHLYRCLE